VAEHIGRAPQKTDLPGRHLLFEIIDDLVKTPFAFRKAFALGTDIGVMPTEIGLAQDIEDIKGRICLDLGGLDAALRKVCPPNRSPPS